MAGGKCAPVPLGVSGSLTPSGDAEIPAPVSGCPPSIQSAKAKSPPKPVPLSEDIRQLAATAYGESSAVDVYEEIAAIASVLVRQSKSRGYLSVAAFIATDKAFAFAAHDDNPRYAKFLFAKDPENGADLGLQLAVKAARNALSDVSTDYSNGAYFWDGSDIQSNYDQHAKVRAGILISDPTHNIYKIESKAVPGEEWWRDVSGKKTKLRGKWDYKFESTAAHGGTIFWRYTDEFLKASGNRRYD